MRDTQMQPQRALTGQRTADGILVEQALAGDQRAFEALVYRYNSLLASYIYGMLNDSEHVSDVLQHVFLKLYVSLPMLLPTVSLKSWLVQVARNRCLDELRKRYRRAELPFSALERKDQEEAYTTLLANDIVNRMKIRQQPDLANWDAMPSA